MIKGIFICSSDRRSAFILEKQLEKINLKVKEIISDPAVVNELSETVLYIDKGEIPTDYELKGKNVILLTGGMDFSRWKKFNTKYPVVKLDTDLTYLKAELNNLGYSFNQPQKIQDVKLKPHIAGNKLSSKDGIVAVYSVKDGVGKSTIALNLAGYIKETSQQQRLLLLDMDPSNSSIRDFVKDNVGVSRIALGNSQLDALNREIYKFGRIDLYISPSNGPMKPDDIVVILESMKKHFDLIIVDTNSYLSEESLTVLNCASTLVLVADNRSYVKEETAKFLKEGLGGLGLNIPETRIIANKSSEIEASLFEDKYNIKTVTHIEIDNEIYEYEERRLIYSLGNKKGSLRNSIQKLATAIDVGAQETKNKFQDIFA